MSDLADIIAGGIQDTQSIKPEFGMGYSEGSVIPFFTPHPIESFSVYVINQYIKSRGLGSTFILAHPTHGWVGYAAASVAAGSQPFLGASYTAWGNVYTKLGSSGSMVFTDVGRNLVAKFICGDSATSPSYMGFGSSATMPDVTDTTLGSEFQGARKALDGTLTVDNVSQSEYILTAEAPSTQPVVIRELGIFTSSSDGSLVAHLVFPTFTKNQDIEMQNLVEFHIV
jgi:hypothetical protein